MPLYTKQDLKDSQELYQGCEFISKKTRSIYAWRTALWVRFCRSHGYDVTVTEDRLIDYLDWLFEIDLVNNINTKKSYVPDILRDHLGSVVCLWRIQTGNNPDLVSPKEGTRFQAKWDKILRDYPRRERYPARAYLADGGRIGIDPIVGAMSVPMSGMAISPYGHINSGALYHQYDHSYSPYQHQYNHPYSGYRRNQRRSPVPFPSHQTQPMLQRPRTLSGPIGIDEATELEWQMNWIQDGSVSSAIARAIFNISISTWVNIADIVGLRATDVHIASSTMAPRLPASVLRLGIHTSANVSPQVGSGPHSSSPHFGPRYNFSVIRSRNPLLCTWNALAFLLFHYWHIEGATTPTFADTSWQNIVLIGKVPECPLQNGLSSIADSAYMSISERHNLVKELISPDRIPVERAVRARSLQRAQKSNLHGAASGTKHRDSRFTRTDYNGGWDGNECLTPLADGESADRTYSLMTANSGYYDQHHIIQRHKVIPLDLLQNMIFPWVSNVSRTIPINVGIDDRRNISRLLDFLYELRIALLQDVAILKCCESHLPPSIASSKVLGDPVFDTYEFKSFCAKMEKGAADEIRELRKDLEMAQNMEHRVMRDVYGSNGVGDSGFRRNSDNSNGSIALPPITSLGQYHPNAVTSAPRIDSSPRESFSPTISPSPPILPHESQMQGASNTSPQSDRHSGYYRVHMDQKGRSANNVLSQSMPTTVSSTLWGDVEGAGIHGDGNGTMLRHTTKRRRVPEDEGLMLPGPPALVPGAGGPSQKLSPPNSTRHLKPIHSPRSTSSYSPATGVESRPSPRGSAGPLPPIQSLPHNGHSNSPNIGGNNNIGMVRPRSGTISNPPFGTSRKDSRATDQMSRYSEPEQMQIQSLREENAQLRNRLQKLEQSVQQRQAEVQNWMDRVEHMIFESANANPNVNADTAMNENENKT